MRGASASIPTVIAADVRRWVTFMLPPPLLALCNRAPRPVSWPWGHVTCANEFNEMKYLVGIDIGGTFTDCAIVDRAGTLLTTKVPSTPTDFSRGMLDALGAG